MRPRGKLRKRRPGYQGVERIAEREVERALAALSGRWPPSDESVHGARKRLKRARAALRLSRGALGPRAYARENHALRDAARPLSEVRDAVVLASTFDALGLDKKRQFDELSRLRDFLTAHQRDARRRTLASRRRLAPTLALLRATRKRIAAARPRRHGWSTLGPGLRRTYRSGRDAFLAARRTPTAAGLHEWRKQAKYLAHQLRMLEPIWPARLARLGRQAKRLSDQLGKDHDLAVLRRASTGERVAESMRVVVLQRIDSRRIGLQKRAMALGAIVYRDNPRAFERRLERRWRAWRS